MAEKHDHEHPVSVNLDPNKVPVLSVDGYLIGSNDHTVTLNFFQATPDGSQQTIVSRVSMTPTQAKGFLKDLNDHIEKFEV